MSLEETIMEIMSNKARTFNIADQKVYMEFDTAEIIINTVLDAAIESLDQCKKDGSDDGFHSYIVIPLSQAKAKLQALKEE